MIVQCHKVEGTIVGSFFVQFAIISEKAGLLTPESHKVKTRRGVKNTWLETVSLTIGKTVKGNMGNKIKKFDFALKLDFPEGVTAPEELSCVKDGKPQTIALNEGSCTFRLVHGESIQILNLPKNSTCSITETDAGKKSMTSVHFLPCFQT